MEGDGSGVDELAAKQQELRTQWRERAVEPPRKVISDRWLHLKLGDKLVIMHDTATPDMIEELHVALQQVCQQPRSLAQG